MLNLFSFTKKLKQECPICFEDKVLEKFCNEHQFCSRCINNWTKKNCLCPCCRKICTNYKYFKYNIENSNYDVNNIDINNFDCYFNNWHKPSCIRRNHKFFISMTRNHKYIFYCVDCHIEQKFEKIIYENNI